MWRTFIEENHEHKRINSLILKNNYTRGSLLHASNKPLSSTYLGWPVWVSPAKATFSGQTRETIFLFGINSEVPFRCFLALLH